MKTDREFLNGIYQKAEVLEKEKYKKKKPFNLYLRYSSVAALFIILPLLFFNREFLYKDNIPNEPRIISIYSVEESLNTAENILIGTIEKVKKNYINVNIEESLYGDIHLGKITIEKEDTMLFKKDNKYLLMLNQDGEFYLMDSMVYSMAEELFIDIDGNKYDYNQIKENIDRRILDEKDN